MNTIEPTARFRAKIDRLNREGLEALRGELVVRQEKRRVHFSKTRTAKDGEAYRRTSAELGLVRALLTLRKEP